MRRWGWYEERALDNTPISDLGWAVENQLPGVPQMAR